MLSPRNSISNTASLLSFPFLPHKSPLYHRIMQIRAPWSWTNKSVVWIFFRQNWPLDTVKVWHLPQAIKTNCLCCEPLQICVHLLEHIMINIISFPPQTGQITHDWGQLYPCPLNRLHCTYKSMSSNIKTHGWAPFGYQVHQYKIAWFSPTFGFEVQQ